MEMEQTKRTQKNHHDLQTQDKRVRIYSKERQMDTKMQGPHSTNLCTPVFVAKFNY